VLVCDSRSSAAKRRARIQGQLVMHHIVLGHHLDPVPQCRVLAVQVMAAETDLTHGRGDGLAHEFGQRRLAGTGGPR
jgi:hypothetical protein